VWGTGEVHAGFDGAAQGKEVLGGLGINDRIILKWIIKKFGWEGMNLIDLAQDRNRWRL
jgi:hypothetical protein